MIKRSLLFLAALLSLILPLSAQDILSYQKPPQAIINLLEAPVSPAVRISSDGEWMLLLEMPGLPSISELSQPELRLAGLRINPASNGQSRTSAYTGIKLKSVSTGVENTFGGLPSEPHLADITWAPDESKIAFTHNSPKGIELWVADLKTLQAKRLSNFYLNDTYGQAFIWTPNGKSLMAKFIDDNRKALPQLNGIPTGPVVQENTGRSAPVPTYQDLLKDPYDEKLFDHYFTSQLKLIDIEGNTANFLQPGIFRSMEYSPDGQYILIAGITLGGTLYLPAGFKAGDTPLPVLIWAYPREFKTASAARQVKGSAYKFAVIGSGSPVYWVTRGYAVLDNADMPVVGESNKEPNDTFVEQIKTPLLLIHGQADNNSGTFPMQSERLYSALKGHGAITRLVLLPSESHAYRAKESVMHMMWEMDNWLEKYVKNK